MNARVMDGVRILHTHAHRRTQRQANIERVSIWPLTQRSRQGRISAKDNVGEEIVLASHKEHPVSLLKQLRDEIVDPNAAVSAVLRKAKILAASLNHAEFDEWLAYELNGYPNGRTLPSYRRIQSPLLGTFSGPFGSSVTDYQIPISALPDFMQKDVTDLRMAHSIRELEAMIASGSDVFQRILATEAVLLSRDRIQLSGGHVLVEMHQPISKPMLEGIIDSVRTRFLDFLLGIQSMNTEVLESEAALSDLPKEQVAQVFNVAVYGDHNVVAAQSTIGDISIQAIKCNDRESLAKFLKGVGLAEDDIDELNDAIAADGTPQSEKIGKRATAWLGKMVGKAVNGTWNIAMASAPTILNEAIFRYYGWK